MKTFKTVLAVALLIVCIVVVAQNTEPVETRVLMATFTMPRAMLLGLTLATGVLAGLLLGSRRAARAKASTG